MKDLLGTSADAGFAVSANRNVLFRPARQAESSRDGADTHVAATRGKRLAWHDETFAESMLNAGVAKNLTGGAFINARDLWEKGKHGTFEPTCKVTPPNFPRYPACQCERARLREHRRISFV